MNLKPATAAEIPDVQSLYVDVWNLTKRFYHITPDDSDSWSALIQTVNEIAAKHKNTDLERLAVNLLCDTISFLEHKNKAPAAEPKP